MISKNKKNLIIAASFLLIILAASFIFIYTSVPVIKIGKSAAYTYSDIAKIAKIERWIGHVVGSTGLKAREDILYYLAVSGVEKEILSGKNISISKENTIKTFESRVALKGLYKKIKDFLGDTDYYRLYVELVAINDIFKAYFDANNPNKNQAADMLSAALNSGFSESAKKNMLAVNELVIARDESNKNFVDDLKSLKDKKNKIYNKIIDINNAYLIAEFKDAKKNSVIINAVIVKKKNLRDFLIEETKLIDIKFSFFSWFFKKDLKSKRGSIFYVSE